VNLSGRRVLVTGADGFIGSHLVETLAAEGAPVRALAQYNSRNDWGWLEDVACLDTIEVVTGDVRDPHACAELVRDVEVVFHLAALIAIPFSYRSPESYLQTNVVGTYNLCHAALRAGVGRFVQMSTSEVYGSAEYVPMDERHPLKAQSPYSASKIGADAVASSFHYSYSLPVIIARPFNTYGPRQSARAVIPTIVSQLAAGCSEVSLGELSTTRDFTYVTDTCRALVALAALDGSHGEVFNIGSNSEVAIGGLFARLNDLFGGVAVARSSSERMRPGASEVQRLCCDNRKLVAATGFRPAITLDEGLQRTVKWFLDPANLRKYKSGVYNE
jgi:NAD dependent epimerase/dehydratase